MPELPEVERVRLSLLKRLPGQRVDRAIVRRADVVKVHRESAAVVSEWVDTATALLAHQHIERLIRRGKQLALFAESGRCVCVHLGMTGSLRWIPDGPDGATAPQLCRGLPTTMDTAHTHVLWRFEANSEAGGGDEGELGHGGGWLIFRDPRRFGGIWTFPDRATLRRERWSKLGPDALKITARQLHTALTRRRTALKAALLDQTTVAGLGNIYVDELLFAARLAPHRSAGSLTPTEGRRLVRRMRKLLRRAIAEGGSTFRDYIDAEGQAGAFQQHHQVYGHGGDVCPRCPASLRTTIIAGRTTVYCGICQR